MICHDCGGSDLQGTCVCHYDWDDIAEGSYAGPPPYASVEIPDDLKQICHFCGVDLFLPRVDLNVRMCVPCGLGLNHEECCKCVICNNVWLVDGDGSVCESCKSL